jgi:hydroxymethylglutaryl-CoA reductase (NADPH)
MRRSRRLQGGEALASLAERLTPRLGNLPPSVRDSTRSGIADIDERWKLVDAGPEDRADVCPPSSANLGVRYGRNIENYIGEARIPIGLAGPLRINGLAARADYYVPMATHEAALVASYSRGMHVISESGGCAAWVLNRGVTRAPGFIFRTTAQAGLFVAWIIDQMQVLRRVAQATTRHGKLIEIRLNVEGNHVYLICEYDTGDAAGQNMVTVATEAMCRHIVANTPVAPRSWFVEANMSGDKKASALSYLSVRGHKVTAETIIPASLVARRLSSTPAKMSEYWQMSAMGSAMSGMVGIHGQIANGLAAVFIACGQDVACVAEATVGVTRLEVTGTGDLYAAVTLPGLIVGTVGGGTGLPTPAACLRMLGLAGEGKAEPFAELCAGVVLAGELSIAGAMSAGHFARAHERLARGKRRARAT